MSPSLITLQKNTDSKKTNKTSPSSISYYTPQNEFTNKNKINGNNSGFGKLKVFSEPQSAEKSSNNKHTHLQDFLKNQSYTYKNNLFN